MSTLADYLAFASMLVGRGTHAGVRILSRPSVGADDDQPPHRRAARDVGARRAGDGASGWGFGVSVQLRRTDARSVGTYGWDGGYGSSWANDPVEDVVGVLLTNQMWTSPQPPPVCADFWTATYAAIGA